MRFLSDAWVQALDEAARSDDRLATATKGVSLIIGQEVTGGPDGDVRWHVALEDGRTAVNLGPAEAPTIWFSQDHATAVGIARGEVSAQRAFMTGQLRVGGDLRVLLDHGAALSQLEDVFAGVRADTTFEGPADEPGGSDA